MRSVFFLALVCLTLVCRAQQGPARDSLIIADDTACFGFPGGPAGLRQYIMQNTVYPEAAKEAGLSGKVYVRCVIDAAGNVTEVRLLRGISGCPECDAEALRVIRGMPKWAPCLRNGKPEKVTLNLPIIFRVM